MIAQLESHRITAIATGDEFSVVVDAQGLPWAWGRSEHGQVRGCDQVRGCGHPGEGCGVPGKGVWPGEGCGYPGEGVCPGEGVAR